jgi:hypothetical protein
MPFLRPSPTVSTEYIVDYSREFATKEPSKMGDAELLPKRKCSGIDCDNDADTLQCPTCQKMQKESFFCSQDCFKRNWVCYIYYA